MDNTKYIVKSNIALYNILISHSAGETVRYAAEELQKFVLSATSALFPIQTDNDVVFSPDLKIICLGKNEILRQSGLIFDYNTLNFDGFFIKSMGNTIFIDGQKERGVLFGAYDFLERFLGINFFAPDCTQIPRACDVSYKDIDIVEVPAFAMRTYLDGYVYEDETNFVNHADVDYYARLRFNDSFVKREKKHGRPSNMYGRDNTHNFHLYVPRETYAESNPEFYHFDEIHKYWTIDLLNGITDSGELDTKQDVSIAKIVIEEMKKDILAMPDIDYFVFEQEDGPVFYPYPKESKEQQLVDKYGRSGIMIRFCNMLARELQKWADKQLGGREINIVTFAYGYTKRAPIILKNGKKIPIDDTVIAADNLVIRLALGGNYYYDYFSEKQPDELKENLKDWYHIAKKFMFWAYDMDYVSYLWYFPGLKNAYANAAGFKEMGVSYLLIQSSHNSKANWQSLLKTYVYSKMMWKPEDRVGEYANNFLNAYYGIVAPYVKELINVFDAHFNWLESKTEIVAGTYGNYRENGLFGENMLDYAIALIEKAEEIVHASNLDGEEKLKLLERLSQVKVTPLYMKMVKNAADFFAACDTGSIVYYNELDKIAPLKTEHTFLNIYPLEKDRNKPSKQLIADVIARDRELFADKCAAYRKEGIIKVMEQDILK